MTSTFKRNVLFSVVSMLTILACIMLPFLSYVSPGFFNNMKISSASADVGGYDFANGDDVALAGEWEFYWDKHIVSNKIQNAEPDLYVSVPSSWTSYEVNGEKLSNGGIASYRIIVENLSSSHPIVVSTMNLPGKCQVFIDGQFAFSNRSVPCNAHNGKSIFEPYAEPFNLSPDKKSYEVVIEVECEYSSGLTVAPVLSDYNRYIDNMMSSIALRFMLIGIVAFFAIGSGLLGAMRKKFFSQFWLILLCAIFTFRMLISNEGYMISHNFFGNINYEIMMTLIYVTTYIIKLCMMMHLINVLGLKINQVTLVAISAIFLLCAFIPYFTYDYIYIARAYMWIQTLVYVFDGYMIYKLSDAVIKKERFAIMYLVLYCICAASLVIDNLFLYGYISDSVSFIMPVSCLLFMAFMLLVHLIHMIDTHKRAQKTAELEKELSEMNMTLMLSQIQPHFMYNALNTIKYLTKKDPQKAESAVVKFSGYLRANMDSLTQKGPIDFPKELDHVRNYAEIEKLRFGDRLQVEYDIEAENFTIPPLTIQPIVENAIKHGVNQKPEGGIVKIKSYETEDSFIVCVEDNGVGYDVNEKKDDGRSHVGVTNIRKRLEVMLGACVTTESKIGEGTTVTVKIPKEEKNK